MPASTFGSSPERPPRFLVDAYFCRTCFTRVQRFVFADLRTASTT
jgi:hypothetical protein